jgi:hypothetical protein
MADPIVIDDGGSLRIRQFTAAATNLDTLLDTGTVNVNNPASPHDFNTLRVEHHFQDGTNHLHPTGVGTTALLAGDIVTITSASGHVVRIMVTAASLQLDLTTGNPPMVAAKANGGKRTYYITNADFIQTVTHSRLGDIFPGPGGSGLPSVLTVVAFAER